MCRAHYQLIWALIEDSGSTINGHQPLKFLTQKA
uniref:Uncharacterized protein n=1 Tax=Rhizophora mucronata TaxID=61149 RepID=A0A2P2P6Q3_RHIMU